MGSLLAFLRISWPYLVCGAIGFAGGYRWQMSEFKEEKLDRAKETIAALQTAGENTKNWLIALGKANDENKKLKEEAAKTAARLGTALDGMQRDLNSAKQRIANASPEACARTADTCIDLLGELGRAGGDLAKKADGHARDVKLLEDSWPKERN